MLYRITALKKKPRKFRLVVYFPINSLFFEGEGHAFSLNSFKPLIEKGVYMLRMSNIVSVGRQKRNFHNVAGEIL